MICVLSWISIALASIDSLLEVGQISDANFYQFVASFILRTFGLRLANAVSFDSSEQS